MARQYRLRQGFLCAKACVQRACGHYLRMIDCFSLLGLPRAYQLDAGLLENAYQNAMVACHPDRHRNDPMLAAQAERMSAGLNQAYNTLADPLLRAQHLLELAGVPQAQPTNQDTDFLMQQMKWRERVENALDSEKPALQDAISRERRLELDRLAQGFGGDRQPAPEALETINQSIARAQYWEKLLARLADSTPPPAGQ